MGWGREQNSLIPINIALQQNLKNDGRGKDSDVFRWTACQGLAWPNIREMFVLWKSGSSKKQKAYTDVEYLDRLSLGQVTASDLLKETQETYRAWRMCSELQAILGWASPFLAHPRVTSHLLIPCSMEVKSMGTGLWQCLSMHSDSDPF